MKMAFPKEDYDTSKRCKPRRRVSMVLARGVRRGRMLLVLVGALELVDCVH